MTNLMRIQVEEIEEDGLSYEDMQVLAKTLFDVYEEMSFEQFLEMEYGIK